MPHGLSSSSRFLAQRKNVEDPGSVLFQLFEKDSREETNDCTGMQAMVGPRVVEEVAVDAGIGTGQRVWLLLADMASIGEPFAGPASMLRGMASSRRPEDRSEMFA